MVPAFYFTKSCNKGSWILFPLAFVQDIFLSKGKLLWRVNPITQLIPTQKLVCANRHKTRPQKPAHFQTIPSQCPDQPKVAQLPGLVLLILLALYLWETPCSPLDYFSIKLLFPIKKITRIKIVLQTFFPSHCISLMGRTIQNDRVHTKWFSLVLRSFVATSSCQVLQVDGIPALQQLLSVV